MKRLIYIDVIKSIAISLVIIAHCHCYDDNAVPAAIFSMCVPLFFAVNGSLLLGKSRDYQYYVPKLLKILFLILFWGIISNIAHVVIYNEPYSIRQCLIDVYDLRMDYCNHLWFLFTLFILYLLYPLLGGVTKDKKVLFISLALICCLTLMGVRQYFVRFNFLQGWNSFALAYAIGGYALSKVHIKSRWISLATFCIAIIGQSVWNYYHSSEELIFHGNMTPFTFVATMSLIKLFSMIQWKEYAVIDFISRNTLGIYLVHWSLAMFLVAKYIITPYVYFYPVLIMIVSCVICWLMNKNKVTRWLINLN